MPSLPLADMQGEAWASPANPGLLSVASWIQRGLPLINTPLQRGVGDGLGAGTASAV